MWVSWLVLEWCRLLRRRVSLIMQISTRPYVASLRFTAFRFLTISLISLYSGLRCVRYRAGSARPSITCHLSMFSSLGCAITFGGSSTRPPTDTRPDTHSDRPNLTYIFSGERWKEEDGNKVANALGSNVDQLHKKATVNAANIGATSLMPYSDENWVAKERRKLFSICSSPATLPPKK